ncbi:hypothetical protein NL676_014153 [Syzygium grande]|nr:hypothetical protein NL676_014153 [Syzygium grande]
MGKYGDRPGNYIHGDRPFGMTGDEVSPGSGLAIIAVEKNLPAGLAAYVNRPLLCPPSLIDPTYVWTGSNCTGRDRGLRSLVCSPPARADPHPTPARGDRPERAATSARPAMARRRKKK